MMEKAIKQRLLGGLVLIAGAALFLPMLLDGSGAPLAVPPMPAAPKVEGVEQVAPRLDAEVQAADQSVSEAHEDRTFVDTAETPPSVEEDVSADAAATAVAASADKLAADKQAQDKATQDKAALEKLVAQKKAEQQKAELQKAEQEKARLAAESVKKAEAAKKAELEKKAAETKAASAKPAATPTATVPEAWVVQVASLSSKDKADALVSKLRQKNYRAVTHQQGAVWKVIVGPELRRDVADSIKSRLASDPELKLSGWVQAYKP
ncbi:MAG: SPOR domain-containing protein [Pedobacter sp.]|nr:SPOR domain-containing protein [Pedobacter sp.]